MEKQVFKELSGTNKFLMMWLYYVGPITNVLRFSKNPFSMTVCNLYNRANDLKKLGLVNKTRSGRCTVIALSELGKRVMCNTTKYYVKQ